MTALMSQFNHRAYCMGCKGVNYWNIRIMDYFAAGVWSTSKKSEEYLRHLSPGTEYTTATVLDEGFRRCDNQRHYGRNLMKANNPVHNLRYDSGDEDICLADILPFLIEESFGVWKVQGLKSPYYRVSWGVARGVGLLFSAAVLRTENASCHGRLF